MSNEQNKPGKAKELKEKELESMCRGKTVQVPQFPMPQPVPQPTLPKPFEG